MRSKQIERGIPVGYEAVAMLMRRAGIQRLAGNCLRRCKAPLKPTATDLVDQNFARTESDQLWVTDITDHVTRESKFFWRVEYDRDLNTGYQRARDGHLKPATRTRLRTDHPLRPRTAVHVLGVHPASPPVRPATTDGRGRQLFLQHHHSAIGMLTQIEYETLQSRQSEA